MAHLHDRGLPRLSRARRCSACAAARRAAEPPGVALRAHRRRVARERARHGRRQARPLDALGVHVVRFTVRWNQIAPPSPQRPPIPRTRHTSGRPSSVLNALHAHGIDVVLQLVGTPGWANGGKPSNHVPTRRKPFGAFATAAAHEVPLGAQWLIWNEPNQARWLRPTTAARLRHAAAQSGVRRDPRRDPGRAGRRRRNGSARLDRRRLACRLDHGDAHARTPGSTPTPTTRIRLTRSARRRSSGGVRDLRDGHDGDAQRLVLARRAQLPARAHLADRVRLPDQPARPPARRLARAAGALRRRGRVRGLPHAARRPADPLPLPRRAGRSRASRAGS